MRARALSYYREKPMSGYSKTLASFGIDEIEPSVCEDTQTNRRLLRENGIPFKVSEIGFLEADLSIFNMSAKNKSMFEKNRDILSDPRNAWSDYVPFLELPMDWMETAPPWMQRVLNKYLDAVEKGVPEHKLPDLPARCRRIRQDKTRCWLWSWPGVAAEGYCRFHAPPGSFDYGAHMQKTTEAARMRLVELQGPALDALEDLVNDPTTVPQARLKAATEILDRSGVAAKQEIQFSGTVEHVEIDPAQAIRDRLAQLADRIKPAAELNPPTGPESLIIDAEVVEEKEQDDK